MRNKITGLICCVALILVAIIASWVYATGGFYHQNKEEKTLEITQSDLDSGEWSAREIGSQDYLLRNYVFSNLAGDVLGVSPLTLYAKGDGGKVYQVSEKPEKALEENLDSQGGFIVKLAPVEESNDKLIKPLSVYRHLIKSNRELTLIYTQDSSDGEKTSIKDEISYFEKTLYSYDYLSKSYGYDRFIDTVNFIDYFLVTELSGPDKPEEKDFYLYKNDKGKYSLLPTDFSDSLAAKEAFTLNGAFWFVMLLRDDKFVNRVIEEYEMLRKKEFSEEYLDKCIDDAIQLSEKYCGNSDACGKEAEELKRYIQERLKWMDANIESLHQYGARSAIKNYTDDPY